jgi:hypothetical protein
MMRMRYRGKRFVVTMAPDGSWTWLVLFSHCLSVKGWAVTKFEAIDQATHIIDRMINFGTRGAVPSSRQGFAQFALGILPEKPATLINLLLSCRAPYLHPGADVRTRWFRRASRVLFSSTFSVALNGCNGAKYRRVSSDHKEMESSVLDYGKTYTDGSFASVRPVNH